jgi:hypothetical protein
VNALRRLAHRIGLAIGFAGFVGLVVWDIVRVWTSPVRFTATWNLGTGVGLTLGLISAAFWLSAVNRSADDDDAHYRLLLPWWVWVTLLAWIVALVTANATTKTDPTPPPATSAYIIGALCYNVTAFATAGILACIALLRRRQARQPTPQ